MRPRWRKRFTGTPSDDLLLGRLEKRDRDRDQSRKVDKVLKESSGAITPDAKTASKLPGDPEALRGIPALAPGVGGTQKGTQPERETIERDRRRRRDQARFDTTVD